VDEDGREVNVRARPSPRDSRWWVALAVVLVVIVLGFAGRRVLVDVPHLSRGTVPDSGPDREYALHPVLAYVHIGLGVVYLVGAPFQLSRRFREQHWSLHRRLGRVLVTTAMVSGVTAVLFGIRYAVGGAAEGFAAVLFGGWFLVAITLAFRAIRRGDVVRHRRWMIRAFMMGLAVGTIRIWIGIFLALGLMDFPARFAVGFWLAFPIHLAVGEWWLATRPHPVATSEVLARA
jgi:uncharacterized membrane protein